MLLAEIPEPPASASPWRLCEGFHWRLHVYHRTRQYAGLTISIVRQSNISDVTIGLRLRLLSDHLGNPVRNLTLASKETCPHERLVTVQLPSGVASKSVQFLPVTVPLVRFVLAISLDVQKCRLEIGNQVGRVNECFRRSDTVERFGDAYSAKRTIAWLEKTEAYSDAAGLNSEAATDNRGDTGKDLVVASVPYNLSTLLESCNQREQSSEQALEAKFYAKFSDVTLIVGSGSDTSIFNLHRCILALASPVFRAMLSSDMLERRTGTVTLPDFTPSAVRVAMRHIYGSPVDVTQHAFELYHFGHQFDIVSLRRMARTAILRDMGTRSCAHIIRFGVAFRDEEVVTTARIFIAARFMEIMGDDVAAREMYHIPKDSFLRLLEDDGIKATECEVLLLALRWLAINEGVAGNEVLKRIRWGLLSPEILHLAERAGLSSLSPELQALTDDSMGNMENHAQHEPDTARQRCLGRPNASLWVPLVSRPSAAFFPSSRFTKKDKKRRTRSRVHAEHSKPNETSFNHGNLRWTLRAKLDECKTSSCRESRLSASLWLEEGDDGRVWTKHGGNPLPVRVLANLMAWNHLGGQLHVVPIDVVFRSAGWGNGWCVRDLFHSGKHALADYGEALQVAVEIREIAPV